MGYISKTEELAPGLIEKGADRPFFLLFVESGLLPSLTDLLQQPFLEIVLGLDQQEGLPG